MVASAAKACFALFMSLPPNSYHTPSPRAEADYLRISREQDGVEIGVWRGKDNQQSSTVEGINEGNVRRLEVTGTFDLLTVSPRPQAVINKLSAQASPILIRVGNETRSIVTFPTGEIAALHPVTNKPIWIRHDTRFMGEVYYGYTNRGAAGAIRKDGGVTLFHNTFDGRLFATDWLTGRPVESFGQKGSVDMKEGLGDIRSMEFFPTSAPLVIPELNLVIPTSGIADNVRTNGVPGVLKMFDATTGALKHAVDFVPEGYRAPVSRPGVKYSPGSPNVWMTPHFDRRVGMLRLVVGGRSIDYLVPEAQKDLDHYANSVVNISFESGAPKIVAQFKVTRLDQYDYDIPHPGININFTNKDGQQVPAVAVSTKTSSVFILDAKTLEPLVDVKEIRADNEGAVQGTKTSQTQPWPTGQWQLAPPFEVSSAPRWVESLQRLASPFGAPIQSAGRPRQVQQQQSVEDVERPSTLLYFAYMFSRAIQFRKNMNHVPTPGAKTAVEAFFKRAIYQMSLRARGVEYRGPFPITTEKGTLHEFGALGGNNWGGLAYDAARDIIVINTMSLPFYSLMRKKDAQTFPKPPVSSYKEERMEGTDYNIGRSGFGIEIGKQFVPGTPQSFGQIVAIHVGTGEVLWRKSLGKAAPLMSGTPNMGGPVVTKSNLTIIGATTDKKVRIYRTTDGELLREIEMPHSVHSIPTVERVWVDGAYRDIITFSAGAHNISGGREPRASKVITLSLPAE